MASPVRSNPEVGLGQASSAPSSARRYCTAPNGKAVPFAFWLIDSIDVDALFARISREPAISGDRDALYTAMRECKKDFHSEVVEFSGVTQRHINILGLDTTHDIEFRPEVVGAMNKADSVSNEILNDTALETFQEHFNVSKTSGCRCLIDQFLAAAILYAQVLIDMDAPLQQGLVSQYKIQEPHLAVFPELPIPPTRIECGGTSYIFHGVLDYGIGIIKKRDIPSLRRGTLMLDPSKTLCGILVARSLSAMNTAEAQITVQVLTCLALTNRTSFTGALTNGALWRFFVAQGGTTNLRIYTTAELVSDKDQGLILELLKDMLGSIPITSHYTQPVALKMLDRAGASFKGDSI